MKTIGIRTRVAARLANLCLRLADPWYRQMVAGAIQYGLNAAARDHKEGRDAPGPWRQVSPDTWVSETSSGYPATYTSEEKL